MTSPLPAQEEGAGETSLPRVEIPDSQRRVFQSKLVDEELKLHVYLPRGSPEKGRRYPVIYLLDSEYSFGCVSYAVRRLIKGEEIPPPIVVGISYEVPYEDFYRRRERDYTPTRVHLDDFPAAGHGPAFFRFLEEEIIPFVNETYPTEPRDRTLVGLSFSGLPKPKARDLLFAAPCCGPCRGSLHTDFDSEEARVIKA